jgi:mono/diheme cytochrome c family protein
LKIDFKFIVAAGILAACAGVGLPMASERDAARVHDRYPDLTALDLAHGRKLYSNRCGVCHRPVSPAAVPPVEWPAHVMEMKSRAHLSAEEVGLIEKYLITMSLSARAEGPEGSAAASPR